jgi:hypothetical protein
MGTGVDISLNRSKVDDMAGQIAHYSFEHESLFEGKCIHPHPQPPPLSFSRGVSI